MFDCLVGVNLLREGLDLPEVAFVAVMDADIEGFLRNDKSLIQIVGRAARNTASIVRFYADKVTPSMQSTMNVTARRRALQDAYNKEHGIIPMTVVREVTASISSLSADIAKGSKVLQKQKKKEEKLSQQQMQDKITQLEIAMQQAAQKLDFETAIALRQEWLDLQKTIQNAEQIKK